MIGSKTYNLLKKRPQVLLLGNGIVYGEGISWNKLLLAIRKDGGSLEGLWDGSEESGNPTVPNNIFCDATSIVKDSDRHNACVKAFNGHQKDNEKSDGKQENNLIAQLLSLRPDAVLTTNYTYQIEDQVHPGYSSLKDETKRKYADEGEGRTKDTRFLIRTCNTFGDESPDIWHIHGELRRKSSLVLTHDEYFREVGAICAYNSKHGKDYQDYQEDFRVKSWIDYFMIADIYVVGFRFDFSEFDLWWLLNRRMRENAKTGNIFFYEMKDPKEYSKICALKQMKVRAVDLGYEKGKSGYNEFYETAIADIRKRMGARVFN